MPKQLKMTKYRLLLIIAMTLTVFEAVAQTDSFDVFTYQPPEFFTKNKFPSRIQFNRTNNDTSFCTITLYKSMPAKKDSLQNLFYQWEEQVVKRLSKASKNPLKIMAGEFVDGWQSSLAIGNFYQNKKKCVVMLYSFRKNNTMACAVIEMSDKIFKQPVEVFSKNLQLKN